MVGGLSPSWSVNIRVRQVEHRPFPPQIEACDTPAKRLASRMVLPAETLIFSLALRLLVIR